MLKNVYYSPHMAFTLMSISCVNQAGFSLSSFNPSSTPSVNSATKLMSISELHRKMGHINHDDLCRMVKQGMVTGIEVDLDLKPKFCEASIKAKVDRKPFPKKIETVYTKYREKVISDLWGPARVESLGGVAG
ncbi:hypothetical protein L208DRAFT_1279179 [Tricholoma matsutake]|nr:hypothetical protein L208DRAFT_1279179 [Tricholoma matsutake 945]